MLHDPAHKGPVTLEGEIKLSQKEIDILRILGKEIADISKLTVHKEKALLWTRLNDLKSVRPMVYINEIPWHEMNVDNELTLLCENQWARDLEDKLRKIIYQWKHMPGDMVVNDYIECPLVFTSTGMGITEDVDIAITDNESDIYSRHFNIQISEPEDIEKIKMPKVTYYENETQRIFELMNRIFKDIIPVKKVGQTHIWYTPWDFMIRWWGVEEAMMDLVMRPEMVHDAYERMVAAWMTELDQFEKLNLLSLDCNNTRIGSGGYGYVSDLPGENYNPEHVSPRNMWGCSNAQIFSSVSPDMHWEFAVEHDLKWLSRWGLAYYGCCEPLDRKIDILRKIPNLRKISVSPWCNSDRIIDSIGKDYVMSRKPSPAIFADAVFSPVQAEKEIEEFMAKTDGECHVELVMKDISTVLRKPQNLWEWEKIAMKVAHKYSR